MTLSPKADPPDDPHLPCDAQVKLRILETTDVHGNLRAFNYHTDLPTQTYGLTRVATLIHAARRECANSMLFDNGDFLQGTPLSDLTPHAPDGWHDIHPVIKAMNALNYDAVGLGNHEFNFGLPWLMESVSQAAFPITCANVFAHSKSEAEDQSTLLPPFLLLKRDVTDLDEVSHSLTIGVFSVVPPQVASWDQFHLAGHAWLQGMEQTARDLVPQMKQAGADLVVALAHTGIEDSPRDPVSENAVVHLAQVPGLDVILAGHSHQLFPDKAFETIPGVDIEAGTVFKVPTVIAGFRGSHLGVVDLTLHKTGSDWTVTAARSHLRPVSAETPEDKTLVQQIARAHSATVKLTRKPLGYSDVPFHSYLALAGQSHSVQIVTQAQRAAVKQLMETTLDPDIPILSASAPFKAGGRGGAKHFTDVPAGALFLRHAADLYPFPNVLCVLMINGAQLQDWLERAATIFNTIEQGTTDQPLINHEVPSHAFDVIDGVSYRIDVSQPPLYDAKGQFNQTPGPGRIRALHHNGRPVEAADRFVLITNNYRAFGGGPYQAVQPDQILFAGKVTIVDLVADHMKNAPHFQSCSAPIWQFEPLPDTYAQFDTGPGLRQYAQDISARNLTDQGDTAEGFARFSIPLG